MCSGLDSYFILLPCWNDRTNVISLYAAILLLPTAPRQSPRHGAHVCLRSDDYLFFYQPWYYYGCFPRSKQEGFKSAGAWKTASDILTRTAQNDICRFESVALDTWALVLPCVGVALAETIYSITEEEEETVIFAVNVLTIHRS